jgi:probable F420-dependent oxidoreductase
MRIVAELWGDMEMRVQPELTISLGNFAAQDPFGWTRLFALARAADAAGVDRLTVSDHVVFGEKLEDYARPELGGREGGEQPTGPDGHWLEPLTTLSVVAGMTMHIRLRTQILLAALRRPVTLAKSAATLDVLSGGRLDLGVGVGWQRAEYEAAGLTFEKRGRLLDHSLEVCQTLWRERSASYTSPELSFEGIHQMPKPLRPDGVPIWISGSIRDTTVRRLVRFGHRWIPWGPDDRSLKESLPRMKEAIAKAGGDPDALQATGVLPIARDADRQMDVAHTMERVPEMVAAGQTDFTCPFRAPADPAETEAKLRGIVVAFRGAVGRPAPR